MLYTIAVVLVMAWVLGFAGIYTTGPLIHLLLGIAIVLILVGFVTGRSRLV